MPQMDICRSTCTSAVQKTQAYEMPSMCVPRGPLRVSKMVPEMISLGLAGREMCQETRSMVHTFVRMQVFVFSRRVPLSLDGMIPLRTHLSNKLTHTKYVNLAASEISPMQMRKTALISSIAKHFVSRCAGEIICFVSPQILLLLLSPGVCQFSIFNSFSIFTLSRQATGALSWPRQRRHWSNIRAGQKR